MKLQQEVRYKSEDVGDAVLLDVVQAIRRRVKIVSREYEIPYIAGYSSDGHTVFIDRHLHQRRQYSREKLDSVAGL